MSNFVALLTTSLLMADLVDFIVSNEEWGFPADFVNRTRALMGDAECEALCKALAVTAPISIRVNAAKVFDAPHGSRTVPWADGGFYLSSRPAFTFDPLFHAGCYYVQEASSMFLTQVIGQYVKEPALMLDLCAAPGGKSTLARSVLPNGSLLVANEVVRSRANVLAENLIKWGHDGVVVTNNDAADFARLGCIFDVVLADVPCSGEGMFRKDEGARKEWSEENVNLCWQRQRRIVGDIWSCLKPGGLLVYSTCTFNREENEDNVEWIANELGAEVLPLSICDEWCITGNMAGKGFPVFRFLPHKSEGEGLFMAVLRKLPGATSSNHGVRRYGKRDKQVAVFPKELKGWIRQAEGFEFSVDNGVATAFRKSWNVVFQQIRASLRVVHAGITLGEMRGREWQPAHCLAMSVMLEQKVFASQELSLDEAIAYLRHEAIVLNPSAPRGYVLLTYKGHPLGFAKNVGNRANNLYPNEWRIRSVQRQTATA